MKKPLNERIAAAKLRQAQFAARVAAMEKRQKKADRDLDTRRKVLVGAMVLVEIQREPRFADYVRKILDKGLTRTQDRAALADLLPAAAEITATASNANTPPAPARTSGAASAQADTPNAREQLTG